MKTKPNQTTGPALDPLGLEQDLITRQEAAKILGIGFSTLAQDAIHGRLGVPRIQLGRRVVYSRTALAAYLQARMTTKPTV